MIETVVEQLARFVEQANWEMLSAQAREHLRVRVLDSLGCAIGALEGEPVRIVREQVTDFSPGGQCTLIAGGSSAPDLAALHNGTLVRYLDFNDSYLAKGETCHPSDNLGAVLAASEYADVSGKELLTALGVAYQVQCRLSDVAPVRAKGFDHTVQGAYAVAAGVTKALGLDAQRIANAIAICGTALNALRVTRTGALSNWKGMAYPFMAFAATHASFLAMRGMTGALEVFEGNKGFQDAIAGSFVLDWSNENLERVEHTIIKQYNAEIHSQSTLEAALELRAKHHIQPGEIAAVDVETFDVAYHIIGGGEEGDKRVVTTKEEADHSLPYMVAVALLDGHVLPEQYVHHRIVREDVQQLMQKVTVRAVPEFSRDFPNWMRCRVTIRLKNDTPLSSEKQDYEGFHTRPMAWDKVVEKFEALSVPYSDPILRDNIVTAVKQLETIRVKELTELLAKIRKE